MLTRIATKKPDVIFMPLFTSAAGFTVRQAKEVPALHSADLLGGGSTFSPGMIDAAGDSVVGFYVVAAATDTFTDLYPAFVEKFKTGSGEAPTGGFSALGYDAGITALKAIEAVAKTDADGNLYVGRKALRDALLATGELHGMTGDITCDQYGDCGTRSTRSGCARAARPAASRRASTRRKSLPDGGDAARLWRIRRMDAPKHLGRLRTADYSGDRGDSAVIGCVTSLLADRYSAANWLSFALFGLTIGGIYALIALGYTMVYGILRMINFAHADVMMVGVYAGMFTANALYTGGLLQTRPCCSCR